MAMRESISSMKAYLILSGFLGAVSFIAQLPSSGDPVTGAFLLAGLTLSLAYFYTGIRLRTLIVQSPQRVLRLFKIGGAFLLLLVALSLLAGSGVAGVPGAGVGLLITWYLFANARRLAAENQPPAEVPVTVT